MLQHLGENGRFYYKLLQETPDGLDVFEHGREISSGLRTFCKEISWRLVKENFRISRRTFEYIVRVVGPDLSKRDTKLDRSLSTKSCKWNLYWKIQCLFLPDALFAWESRFTRSLHDRTKRFVENVTNTRSGSEILPSHKRIYLSSRPWLPTVTLLDHSVITTFTCVAFWLLTAKCLVSLITTIIIIIATWRPSSLFQEAGLSLPHSWLA